MTFQPISTGINISGNVISSVNSSTIPLAANATFTGTFENVLQYQEISIEIVSNVDGTLFLDISADGSTVLTSFPIATVTGVAFLRSALPQAFVRIRYTNGATLQTTLTLTTIYRPISGGVTQVPINNPVFNATLASNTRSVIFSQDTNGNYNAIGMNLDGGLNVHVTDFPVTQPVSGTVDAWLSDGAGNDITSQANGTKQALDVGIDVAGIQIDPRSIRTLTSTDTVTANAGTGNFTVVQPTGTNLHTVVDSGSITVTQATGTNLHTVLDSGTLTSITNALPAGTNTLGTVSLGNTTGKSVVMKTGSLVTTAVTVDQVILTYTVTSGKTLYLEYAEIDVSATAAGHNDTIFGTASLEIVAGTKVITNHFAGPGVAGPFPYSFCEPIPVSSGTVIRVVTTPGATTSFTWIANFGGYEK